MKYIANDVPCADGVRVAVHDLGGPADADADILLFSHATGLHGRTWDPMAAQLSDRYRCFAIDHRGHGVSETPDGAGLAWSHMGDAPWRYHSGLIGPHRVIHGVGHSMGGAALVLAAIRRPLRLRSLWLFEPVIVPPGVLPASGAPNVMADAADAAEPPLIPLTPRRPTASKPPLDELHPAALRSYVMGGFAPQPDGTVRLRCLPATEATVFRGRVTVVRGTPSRLGHAGGGCRWPSRTRRAEGFCTGHAPGRRGPPPASSSALTLDTSARSRIRTP